MDVRADEGLKEAHYLTIEEIDQLCRAYRENAVGDILIGMRGTARLLTMSVPPHHHVDAAIRHITVIASRLRAAGCDGYIFARRVRIVTSESRTEYALLVEEFVQRRYAQCLTFLDGNRLRRLGAREFLEDSVSGRLRDAFAI